MRKKTLGAALAAFFFIAGTAHSETPLERGEYLVRGPMGCGNCHTPLGPDGPVAGQELAGRLVEKTDMFTAIAPNITPASRVARWSDAELGKAIREGIRPDGTIIGPPMPFIFYRDLSDNDLAAIVAFLRTVPAAENDPGKSEYKMPLPPAYGPPVTSVADVPRGVTVEYGKYLAGPVRIASSATARSPRKVRTLPNSARAATSSTGLGAYPSRPTSPPARMASPASATRNWRR
jgi:mono/diheme cytochrome c family protein